MFTIVIFYKWRVHKYSEGYEKINKDVFSEFFSSLKPSHVARFCIVTFIIKRWLFIVIIIILYEISNLTKIIILIAIQLIDTIAITIIRPYQKSRLNLIESLNQLIVLFLMICLMFQYDKSSWSALITNMFVFVIIANSGITVAIVSFMLAVDIIWK